MNIISFDPSLNSTGYAVFNSSGKLIDIGSIEPNVDDTLQSKLFFIGKCLKKIKKKHRAETILIERGFSRFNAVTQKLFRVHGLINYIFYDIPQEYVVAKTVRKELCGDGNIKKADFFNYISSKYKKIVFKNDDELDAFALGLYYIKSRKVKK